jgi:hypothetical protein
VENAESIRIRRARLSPPRRPRDYPGEEVKVHQSSWIFSGTYYIPYHFPGNFFTHERSDEPSFVPKGNF